RSSPRRRVPENGRMPTTRMILGNFSLLVGEPGPLPSAMRCRRRLDLPHSVPSLSAWASLRVEWDSDISNLADRYQTYPGCFKRIFYINLPSTLYRSTHGRHWVTRLWCSRLQE